MPNERSKNVEIAPLNGEVFLTWEDLWVTASSMKNGDKAILKGLTGYARPSELMAIMGPSGCGKSTLLDTIAGRLGSSTRQSGEILINGRKQSLAYGTSAYVTQEDTLMATLTVEETVYYSAELQLPNSMPKSEKKQIADMTMKEMGLQDAMETRIGGWSGKGISGGQKRRVSICLEILTRPKLLFLDEPTSGLDSAASYHVMKTIASQCQGRTIIASIHQPSAEVFSLFHSLCLLSSGRTVYFGPASAAIEFFALSGYPCPTLQNPSDHFLKTINSDFDQDIEEGPTSKKSTEEVINILIESYISSDKYKDVQSRVAQICKQEGEVLEKRSHASFTTQSLVLTRRSFVNMSRDLGYYWLRLAVYIVIAVGLGTIYYDVGFSFASIQARGSMLMFVASFITFMAIGGFPSFVEELKVFQREKLNGHYGSGSFAIANTLSAMPYLLLVSFIPGAIAYFLTGLQRGYEQFIFFALVLFTCMMLVESLMMIIASIMPNFLMGLITGAGIQAIMILSGGFFRSPDDLPRPFWKYPLHYVAFHRYAYEGLFKNEFEGLKIHVGHKGKTHLMSGEDILKNTWKMDMDYSKWVDLAILLGMLVSYRLLFLLLVKAGEKVKPAIRAVMSTSPQQISSAETPLHGHQNSSYTPSQGSSSYAISRTGSRHHSSSFVVGMDIRENNSIHVDGGDGGGSSFLGDGGAGGGDGGGGGGQGLHLRGRIMSGSIEVQLNHKEGIPNTCL
ncbi:ABC transporter G family member 11 [Capsicum chinense]|nr:ABC transporter G family member 11 [Capsicum chinense]